MCRAADQYYGGCLHGHQEPVCACPQGSPGAINAMDLFGRFVLSWISRSEARLVADCTRLESESELGAALNQALMPPVAADGSAAGWVRFLLTAGSKHAT